MFRKIVSYEVECDLCKKVWRQENEPSTNVLIEEEDHLLCPECLVKLKNMFVTSMFPTGTTYQDVTNEPIPEPQKETTDARHKYVKEGTLYVDNPVWDTPKLKRLVDLYNAGKTHEEIAKALNTTKANSATQIRKIRQAKPGWPLYQFKTKLCDKKKPGRKKSVTEELMTRNPATTIILNKAQIRAVCTMWSNERSKDEIASMLNINVDDVRDVINAVYAAKRGVPEYAAYEQFTSLITKEVTA